MKSQLERIFKKSEKMEDSLKSIIDKASEFEIDECTPNKPKKIPLVHSLLRFFLKYAYFVPWT